MTAVDYRPTVRRPQVTPYTTKRRIVGTPTEVARTVDRVRLSGRLVAMSRPRLTSEGDGRVYVDVRYMTPPVRSPLSSCAYMRRPWELSCSRLPLLSVALVLVLVVWAALGRAGVCPGLHCPGCSHGGHR